MAIRLVCKLALAGVVIISPAAAQIYDDAALKKWSDVSVVHYEVIGVVSDKHVQIPATDADLYADVIDKVTLSFYWDKNKRAFVGDPKMQNHQAAVSNLVGMEKGCSTGSIKGRYEHFDVMSMKADGAGAIELTGVRIHPDTAVAESCGSGLRNYAGATEPRTEHIAPPDPVMLAYRSMMPKDGPIRFSDDGLSIIATALNNNWVWTYTPTPKSSGKSDLDDLEIDR